MHACTMATVAGCIRNERRAGYIYTRDVACDKQSVASMQRMCYQIDNMLLPWSNEFIKRTAFPKRQTRSHRGPGRTLAIARFAGAFGRELSRKQGGWWTMGLDDALSGVSASPGKH